MLRPGWGARPGGRTRRPVGRPRATSAGCAGGLGGRERPGVRRRATAGSAGSAARRRPARRRARGAVSSRSNRRRSGTARARSRWRAGRRRAGSARRCPSVRRRVVRSARAGGGCARSRRCPRRPGWSASLGSGTVDVGQAQLRAGVRALAANDHGCLAASARGPGGRSARRPRRSRAAGRHRRPPAARRLVDGGDRAGERGVWFIVTENAIPASAQKSVNACVAPRCRSGPGPAGRPRAAGSCASASLSTAMWSEAVCAGALPAAARRQRLARASRNASSG